jgi:phage portal protein BeeE
MILGLRNLARRVIGLPPMGKTASGFHQFFDRPLDAEGIGQSAHFREPFAQSVWVQRAIKHIAGPIAAVPLTFTTDRRGGEQRLDDPRLAAFWENPAVALGYADFIKATVGWRKLAGESFWILGDDWLVPFPDASRLSRLILARPDRMRHVVAAGELLGWEYLDGAGRRHTLLPEQVIQLKQWNPYDDWRGLSDFESAAIAAETNYLSGIYGRNLMRNNGDRGPYIVAKGGIVDDKQREQIIAELRAKRAAAGRGDFRAVFLTGEITVEDPAIQALDASVLGQSLQNRHEVFIAFGVPPSMADIVASYSVGSASDRFRLIEDACMPEGESIADGIQLLARRQTGKVLYVFFSWDEHSVMQQVRRERIDAAMKLWGMGVPLELVNRYLLLGLPAVPGWEIGYLPFSVAPVGGLPPEKDPALAEPAEAADSTDAAVQDMLKALAAGRSPRRAPAGSNCCGCGLEAPLSEAQKARDPAAIARWRDHMAKRHATVRSYESAFNRELMRARAEVLSRIDRRRIAHALRVKAAAADFLFDLGAWREGVFARLRRVGAEALRVAGQQLFIEVKRDDPFAMAPEAVLQFLRGRENHLAGTTQDIWEQIRGTLDQGLQAGDTMEELAARVRAEFNGISRERATTIAQSETAAAYGTGRNEAMRQAGVRYKAWLTSGNDNVRDAHLQAGLDYPADRGIPVDDPFIVGEEELMFPGDPTGSPGNVINCHCVAIAVAEPEGEA